MGKKGLKSKSLFPGKKANPHGNLRVLRGFLKAP